MYSLFITALIASCKCNNSNEPSNPTNAAATPLATNTSSNNNTDDKKLTQTDDGTSEINRMYLSEKELRNNLAIRKQRASASNTTGGFYPEGSSRRLTEYDIQYLSAWGHKVMLNEIYARHGMIFKDKMLQRHFKGQKWYKPLRSNVFAQLTKIEKLNVTFLINTEPKSE